MTDSSRLLSFGRSIVASPRTSSEADRRLVAAWAADCAERVLGVFEAEAPDDGRPRALLDRARGFARGDLSTAGEIRRRFSGGVGRGEVGCSRRARWASSSAPCRPGSRGTTEVLGLRVAYPVL
ncbi:MAG: putative immunity protein [Kineosporiaceae bacterium]